MKNIYTTLAAMLLPLTVAAGTYTDRLHLLINGEAANTVTSINIEQNADQSYRLTLIDFKLVSGDSEIALGDITADNMVGTISDDTVSLNVQQQAVAISDPIWSMLLTGLTVDINAKFTTDKLHAVINIDLTQQLGQVVVATFGKEYYFTHTQLQNSGFEDWGNVSSPTAVAEPRYWHSFSSASGALAALAGNHCYLSEDAYSGKYSARLVSTSIFGIVANGTMTTGRLNAGSMSAADVQNHSYMDCSSTDTDKYGDPFYQQLTERPDSIAFWVKFTQGTPNAAHPYATMSAVITDGTYYQDPENNTYTNKVATAKNNTIAVTNGQWVRCVTAFDYLDTQLEPKALLITFSTNATPGQGSGSDEMLVDEVELIYNDAEDPTDIRDLTAQGGRGTRSSAAYSVSGQRVGSGYRGIVITDGRKIVR